MSPGQHFQFHRNMGAYTPDTLIEQLILLRAAGHILFIGDQQEVGHAGLLCQEVNRCRVIDPLQTVIHTPFPQYAEMAGDLGTV